MSIQLKVNSFGGGEAGNLDVSESNFGVDFNESLIHQVVVAYQAGGRMGTRAQKIARMFEAEAQNPGDKRGQDARELVLFAAQFFVAAVRPSQLQHKTLSRR